MDPRYRSEVNRDVPPAAPAEFRPVPIGPITVWPPVVLAPREGPLFEEPRSGGAAGHKAHR